MGIEDSLFCYPSVSEVAETVREPVQATYVILLSVVMIGIWMMLYVTEQISSPWRQWFSGRDLVCSDESVVDDTTDSQEKRGSDTDHSDRGDE